MGTENEVQKVNDKKCKRKLTCSQRVYDAITEDCIREYKKHHPDRTDSHITQSEILDILSRFYLESY